MLVLALVLALALVLVLVLALVRVRADGNGLFVYDTLTDTSRPRLEQTPAQAADSMPGTVLRVPCGRHNPEAPGMPITGYSKRRINSRGTVPGNDALNVPGNSAAARRGCQTVCDSARSRRPRFGTASVSSRLDPALLPPGQGCGPSDRPALSPPAWEYPQ